MNNQNISTNYNDKHYIVLLYMTAFQIIINCTWSQGLTIDIFHPG